MTTRMSRWLVLAACCAMALGARGSDETGEGDSVFWSDPRGVIFSLDGLTDGLDMVRLGELRVEYEEGMAHLDAGRWEEAAEALQNVASELPIPEAFHGAAIAQFQLERYAHARQLLEMSLGVAPDDVRVNNLLGLVLGALGRPEEAHRYLQRSRELSAMSGAVAFEAFAMLNLAQMELELGRPDAAEELADGALTIGKERRYGNVTAVARNILGNVALYRGDLKAAEKQYRKSMQVERRGRGNEDQGALLNNLANVMAERGELSSATELLLEAVEASRKAGHRAQEGGVLVTLAGLEYRLGDVDGAQGRLERALSIFDDLDLQRGRAEVRLQQARFARGEERADEADEFLELARIALRDLALPQLTAELDLLSCEVLLDRGDPRAAMAAGEAAYSWFTGAARPVDAAGAELCRAEAQAQAGEIEGAEGTFHSAVSALEGATDRARLADAQQRFGLFQVRHGDTDEGVRRLDAAAEWLREVERHRELGLARSLQGYALHQRGLSAEALVAFDQADVAARAADDQALVAQVQGNRIQLLVALGRHAEARTLAGETGDPDHLSLVALAESQAAFHEGLASMEEERWPAASAAFRRALDGLPEDDTQLRPATRTNLRMVEHQQGLDALAKGDLAVATRHLEQAMDQLALGADPATEARLLHDLAVVRLELDDLDRARALLDQALAAAGAAADPDLERSVQFQLGLALLDEDPAAALQALRRSVELAEDAGDELAAASLVNLGILLYRSGDHRGAFDALVASREVYGALGRGDQVEVIDGYLEEFPPQEDP